MNAIIQDDLSFHAQLEEQFAAGLWEKRERGELNREQFVAAIRSFRKLLEFFVGHICGFEHPRGMPIEEYFRWWASLTDGEQKRWKEANACIDTHNLLTVSGRTQLLSYIGSNAAVNAPFSQYFAVGTFPIANVFAGDTSVQSELYRQVPNSAIVTGTQVDVQTVIAAANGNGAWTNCGLFGLSATSTSGSGTLMTHALLSYNKTSAAGVTVDYVINLQ